MSFESKLQLSDDNFEQPTGSTLTFSGTTNFSGTSNFTSDSFNIDGQSFTGYTGSSGGGDLEVFDITDHANNLSITARGFYVVGAPSTNTGLVLADSNPIGTLIKVLNDRSSSVNSLVAAEGSSTINDGSSGETVVIVGTSGAGKQVACFKKISASRWISWLNNLTVPVTPE